MKKAKQNKISSKETKLPIIQSNLQKGSLKNDADSKEKITQKKKKSNVAQIPNIPLTKKNIPNETSNLSNKTKNEKNKRKINNYNNKEEENTEQKKTKEEGPRITEEKLKQLKMERKKRLQKEKQEEEKEIKLYTELVEEYKNNKKNKKNYNSEILEKANKITNISGAKAQKILEEGGMLDAYKYVLSQLCKQGLPSGNIFEYASIVVKNYERKWKEKKSKMTKEKIDKYYEEKQKEMENENKDEVKIINKSLEHREELKFIQSLDKSRSKRNIVPRFSSFTENDNNTLSSNIERSYDNKKNKKINVKEDNMIELDKNNNKYPKGGNNKNNK